MDKEKKELLKQWLDKGKEELGIAEFLSANYHPTPDETVCYLCQQSAEKYIKGYIFYNDIETEKTHNLKDLLKVCQNVNAEFSLLIAKVSILNDYSVLPRYPNELGISEEDMKRAISYAKSVQEFILNAIKKSIDTSEFLSDTGT